MMLKNKFREDIHFQVSVIMPVYKAEKFIMKAVLSAAELKEVGEIILIEDGSPDNSLNICEELVKKFKKVKLFRHLNGDNRGAGASRNLGIKYATCNYISFLDADDWYLPNRFLKDKKIFNHYPNADAVYSCSILEENSKKNELRDGAKEDIRKRLGQNITSKSFYKNMLLDQNNLFHTNSVTIKKSFLQDMKLFDVRLRLHQDTELWHRLIRIGNFYASEISRPVSITRRHENNRITSRTNKSQLMMVSIFIENVGINNLYTFEKEYLLKNILRLKSVQFSSKLIRRFYFYSNYIYFKFNKNNFFKKFKKKMRYD